jgi:hypothetical protein
MAQKTTATIQETMTLYCTLMDEIKTRHLFLRTAAAGNLPIHPKIAYEFCFLQLRMICELIAIACVVAHGDLDVSQSGKMRNEDRVGVILKILEEAHPRFYPQPSRQVHDTKPPILLRVEEIRTGFLTKDELPKLYALCGDVLHKGKVKRAGTGINQAISFKEIAAWGGKIATLLNHHQIALHNSTSQVWVLMNAKQDGKVYWSFMQRVDQLPDSSDASTENVV